MASGNNDDSWSDFTKIDFGIHSTARYDDDEPILQQLAEMQFLIPYEDKPRTFTYFPYLPLEIRRKIWRVHATNPKFIEVRGHLVGCSKDDEKDKECGAWCGQNSVLAKDEPNTQMVLLHEDKITFSRRTLKFVVLKEDRLVATTLAACLVTCREARDEIEKVLPNRLPSVYSHYAIRLDASKTALLIQNMVYILKDMENLNLGDDFYTAGGYAHQYLCSTSYLGANIKKLVVDGGEAGIDRYFGDIEDGHWKSLLGNFFQNIDELIVYLAGYQAGSRQVVSNRYSAYKDWKNFDWKDLNRGYFGDIMDDLGNKEKYKKKQLYLEGGRPMISFRDEIFRD